MTLSGMSGKLADTLLAIGADIRQINGRLDILQGAPYAIGATRRDTAPHSIREDATGLWLPLDGRRITDALYPWYRQILAQFPEYFTESGTAQDSGEWLAPPMTSASTPVPFVASADAAPGSVSSAQPWCGFARSVGGAGFWESARNGAGRWIQIDRGKTGGLPLRYLSMNGNLANNKLKDVFIRGSDNLAAWDTLISDPEGLQTVASKSYAIPDSQGYRYYRITLTPVGTTALLSNIILRGPAINTVDTTLSDGSCLYVKAREQRPSLSPPSSLSPLLDLTPAGWTATGEVFEGRPVYRKHFKGAITIAADTQLLMTLANKPVADFVTAHGWHTRGSGNNNNVNTRVHVLNATGNVSSGVWQYSLFLSNSDAGVFQWASGANVARNNAPYSFSIDVTFFDDMPPGES